jgi:hypothetical protein
MSIQSNYDLWLESVDYCVQDTAGVSVFDLTDQPFRDWFEDGIHPQEAADLALEDNGWEA